MSDKPVDPMESARRGQRPEQARRFYKNAAARPHENGFALFLDGKVVKTPGRKPLAVEDRVIADALAAEWEEQGERIDPFTMPVTRIVNAAIDRVGGEMAAVRAEIVKYAGTDLVCYRADAPQSLVDAQAAAWDPLVAWARDALGARFVLAIGVVPVPQEDVVLSTIDLAVAPFDALLLAALSTVTTLTGSAVITLALARGRLSAEEAWSAAHVDEDWQMSQWGRDEAAILARAFRWREMAAAALILRANAPS